MNHTFESFTEIRFELHTVYSFVSRAAANEAAQWVKDQDYTVEFVGPQQFMVGE